MDVPLSLTIEGDWSAAIRENFKIKFIKIDFLINKYFFNESIFIDILI